MARPSAMLSLAAALGVCACSGGHNGAAPESVTTTSRASSDPGCRFASLAEMSSAAKLSLTHTPHREYPGCLYSGSHGYVELQLFATSDWDAKVTDQSNQSGAYSFTEDVPNLGVEAKRVSPVLFIKADSEHSFWVLVAPSQARDDEIAVAKVLLPRIHAG